MSCNAFRWCRKGISRNGIFIRSSRRKIYLKISIEQTSMLLKQARVTNFSLFFSINVCILLLLCDRFFFLHFASKKVTDFLRAYLSSMLIAAHIHSTQYVFFSFFLFRSLSLSLFARVLFAKPISGWSTKICFVFVNDNEVIKSILIGWRKK